MDGEILYQKKFQHEDIPSEEELSSETTLPTQRGHQTFDEFYEALQASIELVPIPEREHKYKEFMDLAIELSENYELDTVITRYDSHITVDYALDGGCCMKFMKPIFMLADDYSFFTDINDHELTISLDYYTHYVCRNGKIIEP